MDPKADPRMKNSELRLVVGVECRDGYLITFSLGELLADIGNRHVWLALDMDGQPLPQRDGPIRLIVPEDVKPGRWAHAVQAIFVVNITAPTTRPAS
jgi:DMSO/TMAO reductase YedYZ molybdopterin-dependent catalytic subunit